MYEETLGMKSVIEQNCKHKGKTVEEVVKNHRKDVIKLIKKGLYFDDEVLEAAHITKIVHEPRYSLDLCVGRKYTVDDDIKEMERENMASGDIIGEIE